MSSKKYAGLYTALVEVWIMYVTGVICLSELCRSRGVFNEKACFCDDSLFGSF